MHTHMDNKGRGDIFTANQMSIALGQPVAEQQTTPKQPASKKEEVKDDR